MHVARAKWPSKNGQTYESVYLRESFRENGKVHKRSIANLTHCPPAEVAAIELALQYKDDLASLGSLAEVGLQEGPSVGAVWALRETARRLGLDRALGNDRAGKLALWQVLARVLEQGSRLSAVRLARVHAAREVLGLSAFDEDDLYENLAWLTDRQEAIEKKLFAMRRGDAPPALFLYDVTSSYLEGEQNELAAYGYNRDGKKNKKQIVIGLLADGAGEPVAVRVFQGNTPDTATVAEQVRTLMENFGVKEVTLVGDRGMLKGPQLEALPEGFRYITAITKPQIRTLLFEGVLQLELFAEKVCEVEHEGARYILKRNPKRAAEISQGREERLTKLRELVTAQNTNLADHPRAKTETALKSAQAKARRLKLEGWTRIEAQGRVLSVSVDEEALAQAAQLDGCYALKTDLAREAADAGTVHARYKDLARVEQAFRTSKTGHLELRPVYVRKEASTRGHVLVVMLSYLMVRELRRAWAAFDLTVEEGLEQLKTLCTMTLSLNGRPGCLRLPQPRPESAKLLAALDVRLPEALPLAGGNVDTRRKLPPHRRSR